MVSKPRFSPCPPGAHGLVGETANNETRSPLGLGEPGVGQ